MNRCHRCGVLLPPPTPRCRIAVSWFRDANAESWPDRIDVISCVDCLTSKPLGLPPPAPATIKERVWNRLTAFGATDEHGRIDGPILYDPAPPPTPGRMIQLGGPDYPTRR